MYIEHTLEKIRIMAHKDESCYECGGEVEEFLEKSKLCNECLGEYMDNLDWE
tara:strand:+ start:310 stop:465 length:156 start_codon:yes stop_codon:yes gene_type:complete